MNVVTGTIFCSVIGLYISRRVPLIPRVVFVVAAALFWPLGSIGTSYNSGAYAVYGWIGSFICTLTTGSIAWRYRNLL